MKYSSLLIAAIGILSNSSCTKVIDIDLNKSNPRYIIEGEITNAETSQTVHITRSVNFSDENKYPAVTNAIVIISDNAGNTDTLTQDQPGYYKTAQLKGIPGRTYKMVVLVDGQKFEAVSTMPEPVQLDTLSVVEQSSFGKKIKAPIATFREPAGTGHYYYFMVYRNHHRVKTIYIDNDQTNDGTVFQRFLPDADSSYNPGDKVCVDLQSITKEVYDYYFSLQQTIEQSSATPANPVTNISGVNVLGYFSAHTADRRKIIAP